MWTPEQTAWFFDHCTWQIFYVLIALIGFQILCGMFFGGDDDDDDNRHA